MSRSLSWVYYQRKHKIGYITKTFFHRLLVPIKARLVRDAENTEIRFLFAGERRQIKKALFAFRPLTGKQKSSSLRPLGLCGEINLLSASLIKRSIQ
jgi:hypothetical protein